jgi:antitoxin component YwqK of YwqJK toxin-antitoxin module
MNKTLIILSFALVVACSPVEVPEQNLVERNGMVYEINSSTPFNGISLTYHPNGQIELMTSFKDGVKDGSQILYYLNGQLIRRNNYKNGKFHGVQEIFSESGVLEEAKIYKNGKQHGVQDLYLEGRLDIRSYWTDGELDGDPEFYDETGSLRSEEIEEIFHLLPLLEETRE